ncbi:MAG: phage gp6-like head-tail connector protein [Candidatus Methylomirabilales bacterium]
MALITDYVTVAEMKGFLRITDTVDDTELAFAVTAASRTIDQAANRHFGQEDPATARYYTATAPASVTRNGRVPTDLFFGRWNLETDDISTTTSLVVKTDQDDDGVFETTLVLNTDFRLWPYNAPGESRPFERIVLASSGSFPVHPRGVEITAKWGWTSVPSLIRQAARIQAARLSKRRDSPFGVAGSPEMGNELRLLAKLDPDVAVLVRAHERLWGWA